MCGGCLGKSCIHLRRDTRTTEERKKKSLFCDLHRQSCACKELVPPKQFELAEPHILDDAITAFTNSDYPETWDDPPEPLWPMLIPEVSDVTETTSRIGVWPDEGNWTNPFFNPIAWDMTGNLFDKIRGAPWVFEPSECGPKDWHDMLGPEKNWIDNILLIDRLPDALAMQVPPSALMVTYLNRLHAFHSKLLYDDDAPYPWLVTHGYPSYIDWPPAWHFNLGIRMISSLLTYLASQEEDKILINPGAIYPDKSRKTTSALPLPYIETNDEKRLLFDPKLGINEPTNMQWPRFPGIIPFVPGADTNQLRWFGRQLDKAGFKTLAIEAQNTLAHENFKSLNISVDSLKRIGTEHILIYGPWPLHIPSNQRPIQHVSYIPSANHMDLTNYPPRYWKVPAQNQEQKWEGLPSYKITGLSKIAPDETIEFCDCPSCKSALISELNPRSIWRWGHMLHAGTDWALKVQDVKETLVESEVSNERLWYQGPSYMVFRRCLCHPKGCKCDETDETIRTIMLENCRMKLEFPDRCVFHPAEIRWGNDSSIFNWADGFPELED